MRPRRAASLLVLPVTLLLGGCGYVHFGRTVPAAGAEAVPLTGDEKLLKENSDLRTEKKILQQELALTRAQGDALRMAIENRAADGETSKRLTERLADTARELATLRAGYAKLQTERDQAVANAAESTALKARLGAAEDRLAGSLRTYTELQDEVGRLRGEIDRTRSENLTLTEQVKTVTTQNEQVQAAVAQLNTQLLAQKDARVRAEQDAATLRTQMQAGASALAAQRTGAAGEARAIGAEPAAEVAVLKDQLDTYRAKVDTLEAERAQLKQQLATLESRAPAPELANVEAKLASALRDNTALRNENDQLKTSTTQLAAAKSTLESQLALLKSGPAGAADAQTLREQLRDAQAQASALAEENARLKSRLAIGRSTVVDTPTRIELTDDKPRGAAAAPTGESPSPSVERVGASAAVVTPARTASSVNASLVTTVPASSRPVASASVAGRARVHVVTAGDTLAKISTLYYGSPARWGDILAANRDILGENNNLIIGRSLRIP